MNETLSATTGRNFIGGEWSESESGETYEKRNPWRPDEVTGVYAASTADDAIAAVEAAVEAFPGWAALPAPARAAFFFKAADAIEARVEQIAQDMTAEMGKPLREARMESARAAAILRYSAGEAYRPAGEVYEPSVGNQTLYTRRRPLGVVGLITPWNFPVAIPVWKLAPALIYGNTVVLKLGYEAPADGPPHRGVLRRGRAPGRRAQRRHGRRLEGRSRARLESPRARALVHGLGRRRPRGAKRGNGPQLPRPARARRPQPLHRDGRRGARPRSRGGLRWGLLVGRPEVHGDATDSRAGHGLRGVSREAPRAHRLRDGRRPRRSGNRGRAGRRRRAVRGDHGPQSSAARPRAAPSQPEASAQTRPAT